MVVELDATPHVCQPWRFQDGDVLVVNYDGTLTSEAWTRTQAAFKSFADKLLEKYGTRIEVIVLERGMSLQCSKAGEHEAAVPAR